jgi:hypothetical protein
MFLPAWYLLPVAGSNFVQIILSSGKHIITILFF